MSEPRITTAAAPASFTTDDFAVASAVERAGPEEARFHLRVPDGWQQGRGAFGGLVLGALVRAVEASEPEEERALRSVAGEITGPVMPGEASIEVTALRRGAHVSTFSAALAQGGEVLARASVVLGRARPVDLAIAPAPPSPERGFRPPAEGVLLEPARQLGPAFAQHYEYRVTGPMPFAGGADAIAAGWIRARRAPPVLGAAELCALADAWWPAAFSVERVPRPMSTIAYMLQLVPTRAPLPGDRPLFHVARAVAGAGGYIAEHRELWTADGELVALNPQTFVVIK